MARLVNIYNDVKDDLPMFLRLYGRIKKEGLNKQQIVDLLKTPNRLVDLGKKVDLYNNHVWGLHERKLKLEKEIDMLSDVLR
jgi:hypothetical protein